MTTNEPTPLAAERLAEMRERHRHYGHRAFSSDSCDVDSLFATLDAVRAQREPDIAALALLDITISQLQEFEGEYLGTPWMAEIRSRRAALANPAPDERPTSTNPVQVSRQEAIPATFPLDIEWFTTGLESRWQSPETRDAWIALFYRDMVTAARAQREPEMEGLREALAVEMRAVLAVEMDGRSDDPFNAGAMAAYNYVLSYLAQPAPDADHGDVKP